MSETASKELGPRANLAADQQAKLSQDQLVSALDTQIRFESESLRNEGWTRWAIWGAIATLTWVATELCAQQTLNMTRSVTLALLLFVIWKFLAEAIWILRPNSRIEVGPVRFRLSADTIHPLRPEMAASVLLHFLILFSLWIFQIPGQLFLWTYAAVCAGSSLFMILFGSMAVGLPTRIPYRTSINGLTLIQMAWLFLAAYQLCSLVRSNWGIYSVSEMRLALVFNAGAFLIVKLTTSTSSEHLVNKLTQLRQHIAFGRISPADAVSQVESLLSGSTLSEVLETKIAAIFEEESKIQPLLDEMTKVLQTVQEETSSKEQPPGKALRLLDDLESQIESIRRQVKRTKKAWTWFLGQSAVLGFYSRDSKLEIELVADTIRARFKETEGKINACLQRHRALKAEAYRAAGTFPQT